MTPFAPAVHPFTDTSDDAQAVQRRIWREMGGERRVELAVRMSESAREVTLAGIRARNPAYTESDARDAFLRHTLGDELYRAAFPSRPLLSP